MFQIKRAQFPDDLESVLQIYKEYVSSTSVSLDYQNNEAEFNNLSAKYSGKYSQIFIACEGGEVLGCAAFREHTSVICEMKRVYVRPIARGRQIGQALVKHVINEAKKVGYHQICLDVLPEFKAAYELYVSLGFKEHEPITYNPVEGAHFLGLDINDISKSFV